MRMVSQKSTESSLASLIIITILKFLFLVMLGGAWYAIFQNNPMIGLYVIGVIVVMVSYKSYKVLGKIHQESVDQKLLLQELLSHNTKINKESSTKESATEDSTPSV